MAAEGEEARPHRWYFTKEDLTNSPSRADGVDPEKELRYRQDAASLIQEMGPRLGLNPLCVSTAIVYMHRFYMINSFKAFDRGIVATAALFLAAKVEELPKKLEFVAKCSYSLLHKDAPPLEVPSEAYNKIVDDITFHELTILQTLGFDVQVKHPHPHVVECMNLVGVSKDLSQAAFFLAHNSQLLTTFCLQYSPTVVACMCIHLTCAWKGLEIPRSNDNKNWWEYVDRRVTQSKLEELAKEFLTIVGKSPTRLKKRIQENFKMAVEGSKLGSSSGTHGSSSSSNRHPGSSSSGSGSSSSSRQRTSEHHQQQHLNVFSKHGSHSTSHGPQHKVPSHHNPSKVHRMSPPPPPPPPSASQHSSRTNNSSSHKHKNHKDHHHIQPPPSTSSGSRPDKHSLQDSSIVDKNKKMKMDESQQHNKHHMSLSDYRQSKKHHYQQQQQSFAGGGPPPQKRKPPPLPDGGGNKPPHEHHHPSNSTHYHSSAPPPLPGHQSKSRVSSHHHNHTNSSIPPPLPPPLPSHSPPPPPPPS